MVVLKNINVLIEYEKQIHFIQQSLMYVGWNEGLVVLNGGFAVIVFELFELILIEFIKVSAIEMIRCLQERLVLLGSDSI